MTDAGKSAPRAGRRAPAVCVIAIVLLAAASRFYHLGRESIWLDEATSVRNANRGVAFTIEALSVSLHPPLFEVLLCGWVRVAGDSEFAVRFPAAVFGTIACYLMYLLGKGLAGRGVGLVSGLLMVLAYYPLMYSQEARMYSLLVMLSVASVLLLWRALRSGGVATWIVLCIVNVLLAYTHLFGSHVILVENLYFLYVWLRTRRMGKAWLAVQFATAVAFLPWALVIVSRAMVYGKSGTYLRLPDWRYVWGTVKNFLPLNPRQRHADYAACFHVVLALVGLAWVAGRRWRPRADDQDSAALAGDGRSRRIESPALLLGMWLVLPFVLTIAASWTLGPCYVPRCLIVAAPAMVILLALGIYALGRRAGAIVLLGVCAFAAVGLRGYYRNPRKEQWRKVVRHIREHREPGDGVVICAPWVVKPFDYYCREPKDVLPRHRISCSLNDEEMEAKLREVLAGHSRVWVVLSHSRGAPVRKVLKRVPWATRVGPGPKAIEIKVYLYELHFTDGQAPRPSATTPPTPPGTSTP